MWKLVLIAIVVRNADGKNENVNIKQDWWETAVFYQIYPRSFMDSDGDGIGDLNGITSRLEYLKELGVDATWLSPIFKSPMHDFGYDVSDYYSIQPEYGTMEDFDQLLKKAKELNIKIILDFVPNHTSNESDWFIKSVNKDEYYSDWYIWEGGHINDRGQRSPPNNWDGRQADGPLRISQLPSPIGVCNASGIANTLLSHKGTGTCVANAGTQNKIIIAAYIRPKVIAIQTGLGPYHLAIVGCFVTFYDRLTTTAEISVFRKSAWTYIPNRDEYYLHQFGEAQPDLNYRNPVVFEEIKSIIKFWLEKGIAGMRINAVNYIMEVDKDSFGGHYPDEPITGKPGLGPDDYDYLHHVYTRDQEETYDVVSQFRDVFDAISIRDNITRIMMTDAYSGIKNAVRYYGEGIHSGAHIPFNFALMNDLNKDSDARDIKYAVDRWLTYKPLKKHANWVTGDHDKSRVASRLGPQMVDAFNMLVLLLPGIALTYMGEEIGMVNGFVPWSGTRDPLACNTDDPVNFIEVSRDPVRTPFQWNNGKNAGFSTAPHTWLPVADSFETVNVASQRSAVRSHYQVYRTLTSLRLRPAFKYGRYESLALNNDVFAFKRWYNEDTYVVVMNFGKTYHVVNLTAFDLIFGQLEVEASSVSSSRTYSDNVHANYLDLAADEALVLRMQV